MMAYDLGRGAVFGLVQLWLLSLLSGFAMAHGFYWIAAVAAAMAMTVLYRLVEQ